VIRPPPPTVRCTGPEGKGASDAGIAFVGATSHHPAARVGTGGGDVARGVRAERRDSWCPGRLDLVEQGPGGDCRVIAGGGVQRPRTAAIHDPGDSVDRTGPRCERRPGDVRPARAAPGDRNALGLREPAVGRKGGVRVRSGGEHELLPPADQLVGQPLHGDRAVQLYADPGSIVHAGWQRDTASVSAMATPHDAPTCEDRQKCWSGLASGATALG